MRHVKICEYMYKYMYELYYDTMRMKYGLLIPYGYFLKEYKFDNCSHVYISLNVAKHFSILRM